jgi:sugar phosphate isomerase/epimerase
VIRGSTGFSRCGQGSRGNNAQAKAYATQDLTRRVFLAIPALIWTARAATTVQPLGIAKDSLPLHAFKDTIEMLEHCHALGAAGLQSTLSSLDPDYLKRLRARADEFGMYLEVQGGLPRQDSALFDRQAAAAKEIGARCIRCACLGGRRYETFATLADWEKFIADSHAAIERAITIVEKHRVPLALENHKDWTAEELAALLKKYGSEYLGVCLDTGNNMALLDDPMETVRLLAPYAVTTHIKDMAVEEYPDGFLLSEVPLGQGMLDLKAIIQTIAAARPKASMTLEMITRDPLKIPCLTDKYWATFPQRNGKYLAAALAQVRKHSTKLPTVTDLPREAKLVREDDNIKQSIAFFRAHLG